MFLGNGITKGIQGVFWVTERAEAVSVGKARQCLRVCYLGFERGLCCLRDWFGGDEVF